MSVQQATTRCTSSTPLRLRPPTTRRSPLLQNCRSTTQRHSRTTPHRARRPICSFSIHARQPRNPPRFIGNKEALSAERAFFLLTLPSQSGQPLLEQIASDGIQDAVEEVHRLRCRIPSRHLERLVDHNRRGCV